MGVDNEVAAVPLWGVLALWGWVCSGVPGGSGGGLDGRGGSEVDSGCGCGCIGDKEPGKKDGPACVVSLCPSKNPTFGSVGRMRPSC